MIRVKSTGELEQMRTAGRITAIARKAAAEAVRPGVTTGEIDRVVRRTIEGFGAKPSFLGYGGFPGSACISVNDEVIHGIPGSRVLKEGDMSKSTWGRLSAASMATAHARYPADRCPTRHGG